ncbi:MAG: J domain-containing protein [Alphaproteobacteria bacterium]|nr:J domain-containing protein [Alphaproteobacteria bacterium]MCW5740959.1 J domain-containing protein [Alphaproteobacteria bacterium]
MRDPYSVLGVARTASADEIRKAYRRLAKQNHPDLHPGDKDAEARFKEISAAHALLSDAEQRKRYDAGEIDASGQEKPRGFYRDHAGQAGGRKYDRGFNPEDLQGFGDMFSDLFGRGGFRPGMGGRGGTVAFTLSIPFLIAARGGRQAIQLPDGRLLEVTIPEGAEDGETLLLKGQGMPGVEGAPAGDAIVELDVQPHAVFKRDGRDIRVDLPITLGEAVLGGSVRTPTIGGPVMLKVTPGSNSGKVMRLRGRGLLDRRTGKRGDQLVTLQVTLPEQADEKLKAFLEDWQAGKAHDPRSHLEALT